MYEELKPKTSEEETQKETIEENKEEEKQQLPITIEKLEEQIKSDHFSSKEQLFEKLVELRNNGMMEIIDNKKMRELLDLYDQIHQSKESPLDTQNFASIQVDSKNLIVSKENNRVLQTEKGTSEFETEFKQELNEMSMQTDNGLMNASQGFENMANKKVEISLMELEEAILSAGVSVDMLNKIRFFITSEYVNPLVVRIDISKGILYNLETSDVYEIKYNPDTQEFEIYKNNQLDYTASGLKEEKEREQERNKPKVKVLKKENKPYLNNAAFTKISFLVLNLISIALLITMTILLKK